MEEEVLPGGLVNNVVREASRNSRPSTGTTRLAAVCCVARHRIALERTAPVLVAFTWRRGK